MRKKTNIYAGVFEIVGMKEYSNIIDKLDFFTSNTLLTINNNYNKENHIYSIEISSGNKDVFDKLEVYVRYDKKEQFTYLCELSLEFVKTNTGYRVDYSGDEEEYKVNYTYGDQKKEQTIYNDSEMLLITGDVYKKIQWIIALS